MSAPQPPAEEPSEARIANELHRRFCSDVPNDGTYTLALNETETIRFFKEMERLVSEALSGRDALIVQMREALEELRDVQNGPPLVAWEADWNKAINKVAAVLALVPESLAGKVLVDAREWSELREFLRATTLRLQKHRSLSDAEKDCDFQNAYHLYAKHKVDPIHAELAKAKISELEKAK